MKFIIVLLFIILSITLVFAGNTQKEQLSINLSDNYSEFVVYGCEGYMPLKIGLNSCKNVCATYLKFGLYKNFNSYTTYASQGCKGDPIDKQIFECNADNPTDLGMFLLNCSNPDF